MTEDMKVRVELWPVAADQAALWLLSGDDAWRSGNVPADDEPHSEVEYILRSHDLTYDTALIHSTSWRVGGPAVYLTYIVAVRPSGLVLDRWPDALPIGLPLADVVGKPFTHAATEPPTPRYVDVLMHALRHVRFLLDSDATSAGALDEQWKRHLQPLEPALSTMYDRHHGLPA